MPAESEQEYSSLIKPLFEKVAIYGDPPSFFASIADLPRPLILLYAAHFCLSEIHNGGFLQLFWNAEGILVPEALDGYQALEMPQLAATLAGAAHPLGSPYPRDREDRWDALLSASSLSAEELESTFQNAPDLYSAYAEATTMLPFDLLNRQVWELADSENGGFQERALRYASRIREGSTNG